MAAKNKWYQRASVQAALVTGLCVVVAAAIGLLSKGQTFVPQRKDRVQDALPTPPAAAQNPPIYDQNYSPESIAARNALRGNLRNLSAAESGLNMQQIASGTFGFSLPPLFNYTDFTVDRVPNGRLSFEVHKLNANEVYAVAFVNADTQRKLQLNSTLDEPATIYSDMWKDAPYAVRINVYSFKGQLRFITLDDRETVVAVDCVPLPRK